MKKKKIYKIKGMDCSACASLIELELEDLGVVSKCDFAKETLEINKNEKANENKIRSLIEKLGYIIV
ncbi:MAG: hypothetical protein US53_C0018G0009 [Candidatus Woesebacteria bacterium GW2011_GWA1_37_7]|uniref:HMA domain-containing protein n=1 Tax=Candidatus Woesebacteria bacterium GW2011_GWA1_37_7 TaxID=1618545 RepID=A0A0G0KA55_9BACT|nr:MAG: hypothetical protein US53_C0018G0009 [Candidatus Woesebacteria bacterium GW2011_GWA1_37_7]